jgi:hypothetical protein
MEYLATVWQRSTSNWSKDGTSRLYRQDNLFVKCHVVLGVTYFIRVIIACSS